MAKEQTVIGSQFGNNARHFLYQIVVFMRGRLRVTGVVTDTQGVCEKVIVVVRTTLTITI